MRGAEIRESTIHVLRAIDNSLRRFEDRLHKSYRQARYSGGSSAASAAITEDERQHVIDLFGEAVHVDKEKIEQGELVVRKELITETQMIAVPVTREELVIERKSQNGTRIDVLRGQSALRIPVSQERVVVRKEAVLNERVTVARRRIEEKKSIVVPVQHEELKVSKSGEAPVEERAA